jgi:hypothetical protein
MQPTRSAGRTPLPLRDLHSLSPSSAQASGKKLVTNLAGEIDPLLSVGDQDRYDESVP